MPPIRIDDAAASYAVYCRFFFAAAATPASFILIEYHCLFRRQGAPAAGFARRHHAAYHAVSSLIIAFSRSPPPPVWLLISLIDCFFTALFTDISLFIMVSLSPTADAIGDSIIYAATWWHQIF